MLKTVREKLFTGLNEGWASAKRSNNVIFGSGTVGTEHSLRDINGTF